MRRVSEARLHTAFFAVGTGNLKTYLNPQEYKGMELWYTDQGLEVSYKGIHFIVPLANVVGCVFEKVDPKALKKVA